jgi:hypothetical protein
MAKFCINWLGRANNNKPAGGKMETPQRKADDPDMWRHWFAVEELIRFRLAGMQPPARKGTFRFNLGRFVDAVIADHPEGVTDPERRASFIYGSAYTAVVSNWAQP